MSFDNLKEIFSTLDLNLTQAQIDAIADDIAESTWGTDEEDKIKDIADDLKSDPFKYIVTHAWTLIRIGAVGIGAANPNDTDITS